MIFLKDNGAESEKSESIVPQTARGIKQNLAGPLLGSSRCFNYNECNFASTRAINVIEDAASRYRHSPRKELFQIRAFYDQCHSAATGVLRGCGSPASYCNSNMLMDTPSICQGLAFEGDSPANNLGYAVQGIGDINGDGKDDFALGAPYWDSRGIVYVVFGQTRPAGGSHDLFYFTNEVPQIGFPLYGVQGGDQWGRGISPVGDVNGDGLEDFMLCSDMASDEYFYLVGMCLVFFGRDDFHTVTSIELNEFLSHTYGDPRVFKIIGIDGWNAMV
eukprot:gene21877-24806_t